MTPSASSCRSRFPTAIDEMGEHGQKKMSALGLSPRRQKPCWMTRDVRGLG